MNEPPGPKLRWYQFSLRSLLLFFLFCSVPFGWLGARMQNARRQRESVEAITKLGGCVVYDYQDDGSGLRDKARSRQAQLGYEGSLGTTFSPTLSAFRSWARR